MSEGGDVVNAVNIRAAVSGKEAHGDGGEGGRFGELGVAEELAEEALA